MPTRKNNIHILSEKTRKKKKREEEEDDIEKSPVNFTKKTPDSKERVDFSVNTKQSEIIKETGWSDDKNADASSVEEAKETINDDDEKKSDHGSSSSVTVKADIESSSASGSNDGETKISEDEAPPAYSKDEEKDKLVEEAKEKM